MTWSNILGISVGLAMDAFAVSIAAGLSLSRVTRRHVFRLAFHFGLFQFMMPVLGWVVGREMAVYAHEFDHWIAFALLSLIGGKMLRESRSEKAPQDRADPTRGWMLLMLMVATSIDALARIIHGPGYSLTVCHTPTRRASQGNL